MLRLNGIRLISQLSLLLLIAANPCTEYVAAQPVEIDEISVKIIALSPPLSHRDAELSGLTWCGDKLILMPQYPERFAQEDTHYFFYLERRQIENYLDRPSDKALQAQKIWLDEQNVRDALSVFDGYEAIACEENTLWLSFETINHQGQHQSMAVTAELSLIPRAKITIDPKSRVLLGNQSMLTNMGDEAIFMQGKDLFTIHEINDSELVKEPRAQKIDYKTKQLTPYKFPYVPYRITDASALDKHQRFWAINYKYRGDTFNQKSDDNLSHKHGRGASHAQYDNVERLLQFQLKNNSIDLIASSPLSLLMTSAQGRNWEGIARLGNRGFIIVTDKHPETILGFVPYAEHDITTSTTSSEY